MPHFEVAHSKNYTGKKKKILREETKTNVIVILYPFLPQMSANLTTQPLHLTLTFSYSNNFFFKIFFLFSSVWAFKGVN